MDNELDFSIGEVPALAAEQLLSERDILEGMNPKQLQDFIEDGCRKMSEIEKLVHLAHDVLDNGYAIQENIILGEE